MKVGDINIEEIVFEKTKELLVRYGVKGWNMNDLSMECSMSKRTLYKIIGTKEDLLYKITQHGISSKTNRVEKYLQSEQAFPALLNNLSEQIIGGFDEYVLVSSVAIRMEYPRINEMIKMSLEKQKELYIRFFQKGKDEGCIVEYTEAETIMKIILALTEYHILNCNNKTEFKIEMKAVLNTFLKGIVK